MARINPYIHFNGNAEEAMLFYRSVFGGEFSSIKRFKDLGGSEQLFSGKEADKIMHMALPLDGSTVLMASDVPEFMGRVNEKENRSKISINTESKEEADNIYIGLSAGGEIEVPMDVSPWGSLFGMFRDKYGIEWMISFEPQI